MSKPMSEQMQKLADRYEKATGKKFNAQTNAQKIRAMTDDELNELFHEIYNAGAEDAVAYEWGLRTNSFEWTMVWLQKPAEEDDYEQ